MPYGTGGGSSAGAAPSQVTGPVEQGFPIGGPEDIPNPLVAGIVAGGAVQAWDGKVTTEEGGIATLGERTDATASNHTGSWSLISLIKRIASLLSGNLSVIGSVETVPASAGELTAYGGATLGATSKEILPYNIARRIVIFQNLSDTVMHLAFGNTAAADAYSMVMPANQVTPFVVQDASVTYPVNVYCATAGKAYGVWSNYLSGGD